MAQGDKAESSMDSLWISGIILLAFFIIQIWFGEYIAQAYVSVRWVWLKAITFIWEKENLMAALRMIETRHVREMSSDQLMQISNDLRIFLFLVFGSIFGRFAYKIIKKNPGNRFKRKFTRETLAKEMHYQFPWTMPALEQDLSTQPIEEGPWAMAMTPFRYAKKYNLISGKTLDERRAEKLFSAQLGKLWNGPDRLNKYNKAIFACLAGQVCRDKDGVHEALDELVRSVVQGNPVFTKSNILFDKYKNDPRVLEICEKHAYQYTVLIRLFEEGKKIGIFPPNYFLWIKPINRTMWFVLNCVLSRTYFAEVSGIYAHYLAEKIAGHGIYQPYVGKAVKALDIALREVQFDPVMALREESIGTNEKDFEYVKRT